MSLAEAVDFHGMPAIRWRGRDGAQAIATLQGAHLVSWIPAGGDEILYLSPRSAFEAGCPIRGGIPVVFPQFADRGPLPQHGFARTGDWKFTDAKETDKGSTVTFTLDSTHGSPAAWPHAFRLELIASIADRRLDVQLRVGNVGATEFAFTAALHTYLRVSDAATTRLRGLRGKRYVNRGESAVQEEAREDILLADEPIDRVYFAAPCATQVEDAGRMYRIEQHGFTDTVVWNPGASRTAQMPDMPPDGYRHMLCVEAAAIDPPVRVAAGATWTASQAVTATRPEARYRIT